MWVLFILLALAALVCFIIGMVNPKLIVFWTKKKGRGMACLYLAAMFIFFVLSVALVPSYSKSSVPTAKNNTATSSSIKTSSASSKSTNNPKESSSSNASKISDSNANSNIQSDSWENGLAPQTISDEKNIMQKLSIEQPQAATVINAIRLAGIYQIDTIEKTSNWANGERYNISSNGATYKLYLNSDKTVNSINDASGNKVYPSK